MNTSLVINALHHERRVALIEKNSLAELYIERPRGHGLVGNVYRGKVVRVLPGMDAAFVDINLDKAGFIYITDVTKPTSPSYLGNLVAEYSSDDNEIEEAIVDASPGIEEKPPSITELLHHGEEIMVQVAKAPIGTKGARLTTHITLPGRLLVFLPTVDHIGVSRRIGSESERSRLKEILEKLKPQGTGFIIRTAAEGADEEVLSADMKFLTRLWKDICNRNENASAPTQLYQDLDLIRRATRDLFTADVNQLIIDDPEEYQQLLEFVRTFMPALGPRIKLYHGPEPLFDAMGIEVEIGRALDRKIWLKSGGYIIIDQTEALTAIDVNTGRYVGKHNLEDTITKINLEAVKEVVCQLRLRDIGGIIIIDFIDMEKPTNRDKVYTALHDALLTDRARTNILKISELGLVEMTRKRVRESLSRRMSDICPYCDGLGRIKSTTTVCYEILRAVEREAQGRSGVVVVTAHKEVSDQLVDEEQESLDSLEQRLQIQVRVDSSTSFHREQFEVRFEGAL